MIHDECAKSLFNYSVNTLRAKTGVNKIQNLRHLGSKVAIKVFNSQ